MYKQWYSQEHPAPHLLPAPFGLPEINRPKLINAKYVANPGCHVTATLLALYPLRLTGDRLVATDIAHAIPVTAIAGATHFALGHVDVRLLGYLLAGSVPGVLIASRATVKLPAFLTNTLVAIMLAFISQRMLFSK